MHGGMKRWLLWGVLAGLLVASGGCRLERGSFGPEAQPVSRGVQGGDADAGQGAQKEAPAPE